MKLFELFATLGLDSKEFDKGIDSATGKGKSFGNGLTKFLAGASKVAVAAVTAVSSAVVALGTIGVKYNADMEMYTSNFKVMLGSQEAAVKKVAELKEFAAKTPFGMTELADATKTLLAFGIEGDKTGKVLNMLGDISLGNKDRLSSLSLAFGQMSSAGKLTGQDLLQMINAGFNPLQEISEMTGKSMSELKDEMAKGAISADMVTEAFEHATAEGGRFYKGMEEASKTVSGLFSTLKDDAQALIGEVFLPVSETIGKSILPKAIGFISTLSEAFKKDGVDGLTSAVGTVLSDIITMITEGAPKVVDVAIKVISSLVEGLIANAPKIAQGAADVATKFVTGFLSLLPQILELGLTLVVNLALGIANALPTLIPTIVEVALSIVQVLVESIPLLIDAGIQLLVGLIQGIIDAIPVLVEMIPTIIESLVNGLVESAVMIMEAAPELIMALINGLVQALPVLIEMIPQIITTIATTLMEHLPELIEAAIQLVVSLVGGLVESIPMIIEATVQMVMALINGIAGFFGDVATKGEELIRQVWEGFTGWVATFATNVKKWVEDVLKNLSDGFAKVVDIGSDIVTGIWNGIKDGWDWLTSEVKNLATGLLDGVKSVLGIASPSKEGAFIGRMFDEGIINGIVGSTPKLLSAAEKQLSGLLGLYDDEISLGAGMLGTSENTSATAQSGFAKGVGGYSPTVIVNVEGRVESEYELTVLIEAALERAKYSGLEVPVL